MFFHLRSCDFPFSVYINGNIASIAQLVEHLTCNHEVTGSTPVAGSSFQKSCNSMSCRTFSFSVHPKEIALDDGYGHLWVGGLDATLFSTPPFPAEVTEENTRWRLFAIDDTVSAVREAEACKASFDGN